MLALDYTHACLCCCCSPSWLLGGYRVEADWTEMQYSDMGSTDKTRVKDTATDTLWSSSTGRRSVPHQSHPHLSDLAPRWNGWMIAMAKASSRTRHQTPSRYMQYQAVSTDYCSRSRPFQVYPAAVCAFSGCRLNAQSPIPASCPPATVSSEVQ